MASSQEQKRRRAIEAEISDLRSKYSTQMKIGLREVEGGKAACFLQISTNSLVKDTPSAMPRIANVHTIWVTFPPDYFPPSSPSSPLQVQIMPPVIFHPNLPAEGIANYRSNLKDIVRLLLHCFTSHIDWNADRIINSEASDWFRRNPDTVNMLEEPAQQEGLPSSGQGAGSAQTIPPLLGLPAVQDPVAGTVQGPASAQQMSPAQPSTDQQEVPTQPSAGQRGTPTQPIAEQDLAAMPNMNASLVAGTGGAAPETPASSFQVNKVRAGQGSATNAPSVQGNGSFQVKPRSQNPSQPPNVSPVMPPEQGIFRSKGVRTHRPQPWPFPYGAWQEGEKRYYDRWRYSVSGTQRLVDNPLKVIILESALRTIFEHARGDLVYERFGILVGGAFTDQQTGENWVEIVGMLPADRVHATSGSVEVSPDEINRLNAKVDVYFEQTHETVRRIGWYHTHPNYGIFMSPTDQTNQKLCYNAEWQMALVVDPIRWLYGTFAGPDCQPLDKGILVLSETQAQQLDTPAFRSWQMVRGNAQPQPQPRPIEERSPALAAIATNLPQQENPAALNEYTPVSSLPSPPHGDTFPAGPDEHDVPTQLDPSTPRPRGIKGIREKAPATMQSHLGPHWRIIAPAAVVALVIICSLLFLLLRGNNTISQLRHQLSTSSTTISRQLRQDQQQLADQSKTITSDRTTINATNSTISQVQQDLLTQAQDKTANLKDNNPLLYRKLLREVVTLDATSASAVTAKHLLNQPVTYTVAQGDVLSSIAQNFNVTQGAIKSANKLTSDNIAIGQQLIIPGEKD